MAGTVLVVEDDPDTTEIVSLYLRGDGHTVLTSADGLEGLRLARETRPDLVILDLMLPGLDGIAVCRRLREESDVPIIMLTARVEAKDRLAGLDIGADDYITKPFSPKELVARVRAVLRRSARDAVERGPVQIVRGDIAVDVRSLSVRVRGEPVRLTPTEFRLLALMMREPGRTFGRDELMDGAIGYQSEGFDRTVDAHIANIRRKLEPERGNWRYIHTVYGLGYRFGDE